MRAGPRGPFYSMSRKKTIKKALQGKIILKLNTFEFYASRVLRIKYNNNITTPQRYRQDSKNFLTSFICVVI